MGMTFLERAMLGLLPLLLIIGLVIWLGRDTARFRALVIATLATVLVLVVLGAYVRLSDAGLGCPDWPGCYGNFTPAQSLKDIRAAEAEMPSGPVTLAKAWKEMLHRYLAMIVGAMIAALALVSWRNRGLLGQSPGLASGLAVLVIFQAALGAWTVTMLLKPAIVTAHLMGGMAIFALLVWMTLRQFPVSAPAPATSPALKSFAIIVLLIVIGQIVLGGWVSTNYAALACTEFPRCAGEWVPPMQFADAFHVIRPLGVGPDGQFLTLEALRAIHWIHRVGALVTTVAVLGLAAALWRRDQTRLAIPLALLLIAQVLIGIGNVLWSLPLPLAVAHNGVAALLLGWLVVVNYRLFPRF